MHALLIARCRAAIRQREKILLGVAALLPDPAFSKRKLMLSVYQGRRTSGVKLVDATRPQNAILEDFLILVWADGAPYSDASSSRITRRSQKPPYQSATRTITTNGKKVVS